MSSKGGKITFELSSYDSKCAEGSLIIQIGEIVGPNSKAEPLQLPGSRDGFKDGAAKCQSGYEDITDIFRSKKGTELCKACKKNTGRCCYNPLTKSSVCECPQHLTGYDCGILGSGDPLGPDPPQMNATMSVILAAVIVFFLCLVVIVIYCTSEQRRKTKRKHAKRLSRDEGKRSNNHEKNNRENEIITENPNKFKPDNQTTRNVNGRYNGSNHESISLLNNTNENMSNVGASFLGPSRPSIIKPNNLSPSTFKQEAPRDRSPITPSIRSYNRQQEVTSDNEIKL